MKQYRFGEAMLDAHYRKRIRMVELDIVHAHSPFHAGSEALRLAAVRKLPLVATFHSKYYDDFPEDHEIRVRGPDADEIRREFL